VYTLGTGQWMQYWNRALTVVLERMLLKIRTIFFNTTHPLHNTLVRHRNIVSNRFIPQKCTTECQRKSYRALYLWHLFIHMWAMIYLFIKQFNCHLNQTFLSIVNMKNFLNILFCFLFPFIILSIIIIFLLQRVYLCCGWVCYFAFMMGHCKWKSSPQGLIKYIWI